MTEIRPGNRRVSEAEQIVGDLCRADDGEFSSCGRGSSSRSTARSAPQSAPSKEKTPKETGSKEKVTQAIAYTLPADWTKITLDDLETATKKCASEGGKEDLCILNPPVCKGNYGVDRKDMPQFPKDKAEELVQALRDKKVPVDEVEVPVKDLKATQDEINAKKVIGMAKAMKGGTFHPGGAVYVSKDGYVLDGHHRWAAAWLLDRDSKIKVVRLGMDMDHLLAFADEYSAPKKGFDEAERIVRGFLEVELKPRVTFDGKTYVVRSRTLEIPDFASMDRIAVLQWLSRNTYATGYSKAPNPLTGIGGAIKLKVESVVERLLL